LYGLEWSRRAAHFPADSTELGVHQLAKNADWIRVDLTKAEHGCAVFCLGGERRTDTWTY
jgi:hypothetical protein